MIPYDEGWVNENASLIKATYDSAHIPFDVGNVIWNARMVYDATVMPRSVARRRHLNGLRDAIGLPHLTDPLNGDEHGPLRVDAVHFMDEHNMPWLWAGMTQFGLYYRFLKGEDITPILNEAIELGANVLRVFLEFGGDGWNGFELRPQLWGAPFYDRLPEFCDLLASRGLRWEAVAFTGAPSTDDLHDRFRRICEKLRGHWNVFLELTNEDHLDFFAFNKPDGILSSRGSRTANQAPPLPGWDYHTFHVRRDMPKMMVDAAVNILVGGWTEGPGYAGTHGPTVHDEPIGAAEVDEPGRRSTDPNLFKEFAALASASCPGATFHSTNGVVSQLLGPKQRACAEAFYPALRAGFVR